MSFSPLLNALDILVVAEVIAVAFLAGPPFSGDRHAGLAAGWRRTEALPLGVAIVRIEELLAASTLASDPLETHARPIGEENAPRFKKI